MSKTIELDDRYLNLYNDPDTDPVVRELDNGYVVVGYLLQDEDCDDPIHSSDGMGQIHVARRGASQKTLDAFRKARGLDSNWNATGASDPLAVALDVYSHSGEVYAVSGSARARNFPDQQWDVGHGVAVWVPDVHCRENIYIRAVKKLLPDGVKVVYVSQAPYGKDGKGYANKVALTIPGTMAQWDANGGLVRAARNEYHKVGYKSFKSAYQAALRILGIKLPESFDSLCYDAAVEICEGILETYNQWLSGDCWGYQVEVFEPGETDPCDHDSCWGFVGEKYATSEMMEMFEHQVKRVEGLSSERADPNQQLLPLLVD